MICININNLIFFSYVVKYIRPTYSNKEELAPLKRYQSETEKNLSFACHGLDLVPMTLVLKLDLDIVVTYLHTKCGQ